MRMAVPTPDHFLPILYTAGLLEDDESADFFNDRPVAGSLTMTGVRGVRLIIAPGTACARADHRMSR